MARIPMVTRTITISEVDVMCLDVTTAEVIRTTINLTGEYTEETALKYLKKALETDTFKYVHVESVRLNELLYGMPESDFITFATILPK